MPATRPYRASDRESAIAALGDARAIDQPAHHVYTSNAGADHGVAVWSEPGPGGEPRLGAVVLPAEDRRLFYQLVEACARDALDRGYERASFTVYDARLLTLIQRDFTVEAVPSAWDAQTGDAVAWEISVDLADALDQLRRVLDG